MSPNRFEFKRAVYPPERLNAECLAREFGISLEQAERQAARLRDEVVWLSDTYQVSTHEIHYGGSTTSITWLSIKRRDREPIGDWRELQGIKNAIVGPEREACELYPAESRKVDTANQYHLFALPAGMRFPFGFDERSVTDNPGGQAKQRSGA